MTILAKCKLIEKQLGSIESQEVNIKTIRSLDAKHRDLIEAYTSLHKTLDQGFVYHQAGYLLQMDMLPDSVEKNLDIIEGKLRSDPSPENLSGGSHWRGLIQGLEGAVRQARRGVDDARTAFQNQHNTFTPPDEIAPQLAPTDNNRKKLNEYRDVYRRLDNLLQLETHNASQINEVHEVLSPQLKKLADEMDTDLPPDVHSFLHAAGTPVGARLDTLTPQVLTWLENKGMEHLFRVKKVN